MEKMIVEKVRKKWKKRSINDSFLNKNKENNRRKKCEKKSERKSSDKHPPIPGKKTSDSPSELFAILLNIV